MKFVNYLKDIRNVDFYPVASLILFGLVFIAVCIYTFSADKKRMSEDAKIPLD